MEVGTMHYQLKIQLTNADFLAFNYFHSLESTIGKKQFKQARTVFAVVMAVIVALVLLISGWSTFSALFTVLIGLFSVLFLLFLKKIAKLNIRAQINTLKKSGKLPFEPEANYDFYEDCFIIRTENMCSEDSYATLERIDVVENQYAFLYNSSMSAHVLPIAQIRDQVNQEAFLQFLSTKCGTMETHSR